MNYLKSICAWGLLCVVTPVLAQGYRPHAALEKPFIAYNIAGTLAIKDDRKKEAWVYDLDRAKQPFSPASTFKIAHTLFALDAGVVKDEFQFFAWDGLSRNNPAWDKHQTLKTAFKASVVWVYQDFAKKIGAAKEQRYLNKAQYGNQLLGPAVDTFWLDGSLRISAVQQIEFLQKLYNNTLPFSEAHQRLVKDLMLQEASDKWVLRGKTGWFNQQGSSIGWYVGWAETLEGPVFFALNITLLDPADLPKRQQILREALANLDVLPLPASTKTAPVAPAAPALTPVETKTLPIVEASESSSSSQGSAPLQP